jgi:redox-sensitive bicupin YhaK (pirin superfamily)
MLAWANTRKWRKRRGNSQCLQYVNPRIAATPTTAGSIPNSASPFADYYDPKSWASAPLRVINEDVISGGGGFGTHGHREMEIVTYVLDGGIEHKDSLGSGGVIVPGELQHMSAGTGIRHSEYNASKTTPAHMLQIWLLPSKAGVTPSYSQQSFPIAAERNLLHLLASPEGRNGSLTWVTDADLYAARLDAGAKIEHALGWKCCSLSWDNVLD